MKSAASLGLGAVLLAGSAGCVDPDLPFPEVDLLDWEAVPVQGPSNATSIAATPDGSTVFAGSWSHLYVHDVATDTGQYIEMSVDNIHFVDGHLVVAGTPGTRVFTSSNGWASLEQTGQSALAARYVAVDGDGLAFSDGDTVWLTDRATLPTASWVEADLRAWGLEDALWTPFARDVGLRGDTLMVATDEGAWAFDLRDEPPTLQYTVGSWLTPTVRFEGDVLLVAEGYQGGKFDLTDPAGPRAVDRLYGSGGFDVREGRYYAHDQARFYVSELGAPGERATPLRSIPLVACHAVVAVPNAAFAVCDDQPMYRIGASGG